MRKKASTKKRLCHGRIQRVEGGQGVRTTLKNHKNKEFLYNTGPDPLKKHKATKPEFYVGPSSARQRNAGWPMMTPSISIWILSALIKKKTKEKKKNKKKQTKRCQGSGE